MTMDRVKSRYIKNKVNLLKEFGVEVDSEMLDRLESLYPNDIMTENYTRKVIMKKLESRK